MLHPTTQAYVRTMLQARLVELTHRMGTDAPEQILETLAELKQVGQHIAEIVTHHLDVEPPAEQPREVRAALHLYKNVLKGADTIRDLEVSLGLSDKANTKPHNMLRDMTNFIEAEKQHNIQPDALAEIARAVSVKHNGNGKRSIAG